MNCFVLSTINTETFTVFVSSDPQRKTSLISSQFLGTDDTYVVKYIGIAQVPECEQEAYCLWGLHICSLFCIEIIHNASDEMRYLHCISPPTSEAGVRFPARPQVGKLVVACRWSAVYNTEP